MVTNYEKINAYIGCYRNAPYVKVQLMDAMLN